MKSITVGTIPITILQNLQFTVLFGIISSNNINRLEYDLSCRLAEDTKILVDYAYLQVNFTTVEVYSQTSSTRKYAKNTYTNVMVL